MSFDEVSLAVGTGMQSVVAEVDFFCALSVVGRTEAGKVRLAFAISQDGDSPCANWCL